jgi:hypothetical protein
MIVNRFLLSHTHPGAQHAEQEDEKHLFHDSDFMILGHTLWFIFN